MSRPRAAPVQLAHPAVPQGPRGPATRRPVGVRCRSAGGSLEPSRTHAPTTHLNDGLLMIDCAHAESIYHRAANAGGTRARSGRRVVRPGRGAFRGRRCDLGAMAAMAATPAARGHARSAGEGGRWCSPVDGELLRRVVSARPDRTTDELTREYNRQAAPAARVHRSSILRAFQRFGYVFRTNDVPAERIRSAAPAFLRRASPLRPAWVLRTVARVLVRGLAVVPGPTARRSHVVLIVVAQSGGGLPPVVMTIAGTRGAASYLARRLGASLVVAGIVVARIGIHTVLPSLLWMPNSSWPRRSACRMKSGQRWRAN
jgi:hypothetical protein